MAVTAAPRDSLQQIAQQLPASPQVLLQLNELLTDMNSGLEAVANLLRRDTALAARIIRISNSVVFGAGGRVDTVEAAVNRVGFSEIYRLTGLASAAQLGDQHLIFYGITGPQLRDNTLVTALACEALAAQAQTDPRVAYTTGLLRSTGKLVLDRYAKKWAAQCTPFSRSGADSLGAWEKTSFGTTSPLTAAEVLQAWRFPASIVEPVRNQWADTEPAGGATAVFSRLLQLGGGVAERLGFGLPGETSSAPPTELALDAVGLNPAALQDSQDHALRNFELLKSFL